MWKSFKITLGIILGLLAVPTLLAIIAVLRVTQ
jgi:maltodextrin utilization protein YvdJ